MSALDQGFKAEARRRHTLIVNHSPETEVRNKYADYRDDYADNPEGN